ncbi:hypothetical protein SAY87_017340 [Trapa incisa]|uniref:Major facilitator superfamily (MFS) profile domain-containing protein n=1 Tax=Trapa incisa TaxID=236973 RepID=A0AAN7QV94_9MYRT|nr:hypothetical protein SAY87_017340 [Trapa incisa]
MGLAQTFFAIALISAFFLGRFERRPLLMLSSASMPISIMSSALGSKFLNRSADKPSCSVALHVIVVCSGVSFSFGLGPITWVYSSEIFPTTLRAQGTSLLAVAVNRLVGEAAPCHSSASPGRSRWEGCSYPCGCTNILRTS